MTLLRLIIVVLSSLFLVHAVAQERYQIVVDRNVCLQGNNAAALILYEDSTVSMAKMAWKRVWGPWRDINEGSKENNVELDIESFMRLSSTVMTHGGVRYENFSGSEMEGSMLYDDGVLKPFDIVEDSVSYPGDKHYELVSLNGAIGWRTMQHLSLGAKVDYTAGTYAKYKDLRHTNTYMRLDAVVGVCLPQLLGGMADVGFYAEYRRRCESVLFKTYGTSDIVYKAFVDYANMTGIVESYGSEGFVESASRLPHLSDKFGCSVQLGLHFTDDLEWYNEFLWLKNKGYYGKESQYTRSYAQWDGEEIDLKSHLKWIRNGNMHILDASINKENLSAERKVFLKSSSESNPSVTYYKYYTPVKMNDKKLTTMRLAYSGYLSFVSDIYLWNILAGVEVQKTDHKAYLNPRFSEQNVLVYRPFASILRRFLVGEGKHITAQIGASTSKGDGDMIKEGRITDVNNTKTAMVVHTEYLKHSYEYKINRQCDLNFDMAYSWNVKGYRPSVSLSYNIRKATSSEVIDGNSRQMIMAGIACEF